MSRVIRDRRKIIGSGAGGGSRKQMLRELKIV